jgi:aryl-alcohol dehydrogenase-like predicted oxidoreductase
MKTLPLGNSDLNVTYICLGTMTFGEQNTESDAHAQLDYALEQGINFIDTAEMYPVPPPVSTALAGSQRARLRRLPLRSGQGA